ncbi:basic secretory protein-like protein [Marinilabilia salmonicolor]|uniref:WD40 repeat protein n=1 Tax=Marinilabilia salmonicolor TaxID=989 RepID=A0A368VDU0_9BACT|nr:basic secretory protein-like protein [Marinilabilia salmonicolor]RCW39319.1 WD40 repeat protein [Marinilabilia salmonicolor]
MPKISVAILWILLLCLPGITGMAQYFGKNKPSYRSFDFHLSQTDHFDIYHYLSDSSRVVFLGGLAEQWYHYHRQILADTFEERSPVLMYRNHADFQQTNAIMGDIGVGTGGVTEGLKRRVVMPFSFSDYQTSHVLGHELVHAFQYHIIEESSNLNLGAISRVPLWMIEGMAEYLSVGNSDAYTAVWMRDALLSNDFPTLDELGNYSRYSPYRFGQAFWSYIASQYGEQYIRRLFVASAMQGYQSAIEEQLGITVDSLSLAWRSALAAQLVTPEDSTWTMLGKRLFSSENSGKYNLSPAVSPDGRYIVFLSERDIYSLDLFLADAGSGEIISKIYTSSRNADIDALEYTETAGSWSPDNRYFAFVAYQKGKSVIMIYDVKKGQTERTIFQPGVDAVSSPVWSPNGEGIAFSAMRMGISNLCYFSFVDNSFKFLTRSSYSAMQPGWSPDGQWLWFITDEPAPGQSFFFPGNFNLARFNFSSGETDVLATFPGAKNLNPMPLNKREVLFLSNVNGRRDLYVLDISSGKIKRTTSYATGIMGITEMSPALSVAGDTIFYSMLKSGEFQIIKAPVRGLLSQAKIIDPQPFDYRSARLALYSEHFSRVDQNLTYRGVLNPTEEIGMTSSEPQNRWQLDYVGNMAAGVMTGRFGTGMAGSIEALFSDVLGNNLLYGGISINGEIYDFGGQVALLHQKHRIKTGVSLSHIPYRMGYYSYEGEGDQEELVYFSRRIFQDKAAVFSFLPLSRSARVESGLSMARYSYRYEKIEDIRSYYPTYNETGRRIDAPDGFWVGDVDVAYVFDNSKSGIASPVDGTRTRIQAEKYFNGVNAHAFLMDFRKYKFVRPFSFAYRLYYYGRHGADRNTNRMTRLFVGYPWLVRGYDTGEFYMDSTRNTRGIGIKHLIGNNLLITNLEWRMPFSGPFDFAWFRSSTFFSELALFVDAGIAWDTDSTPVAALTTTSDDQRIPVFSTGMSLRLNFFGFIVVEPYLAFPFHQNRFYNGQFGFNVFPGW